MSPVRAASIIEVRHAVEDDQPRHTYEIVASRSHMGDEGVSLGGNPKGEVVRQRTHLVG